MVKSKEQKRKQIQDTKYNQKQITCIICPMGCILDTECTKTELKSIHGHKCKSGKIYAKEEIFNPTRTVTTTIKVQNGILPLVSVKTDKPVPKGSIFQIMDEVKQKSISAPIKIGEIIIENIKQTGANIIATKTVDKNKMN